MFGYLPLPYDFTVFDLFDSVGIDITIWRFLTLSSEQYEHSLYRVYHLVEHLQWLLVILRDQDRGNDHHPRRSSYDVSAWDYSVVDGYRLLVVA
jgi:hypothetical protein